jgi:hypothetical protein
MRFQFKPFFQALWLSFKPSSLKKMVTMLGIWSIFLPTILVNNIALFMDHILFPGFRKVTLTKPVFIIGPPRSGTTFFHRLLCKDRDRYTFFKTYEVLFPSVILRKLVRTITRITEWATGDTVARWMNRKETELLNDVNHIHKLSINQAEEEEGLFFFSFWSIDLHFLFPFLSGMEDMNRFATLPDPDRNRLLTYYEQCLKRHMFMHGDRRVFLSKNPNSTSKLYELYSHFPDSCFILLIRNPLEQIPSTLNLFGSVWKMMSGEVPGDSEEFKRLYDINVDMYRYMLKTLPSIDNRRIALVRYDDLIADPEKTVKDVYAHFGFDMSEEFSRILSMEKKRNATYKSTHEYSLEKYGLTSEKIYGDLEDVFKTFGFGVPS